VGEKVEGREVLGGYAAVTQILAEHRADQLFVALPMEAHHELLKILNAIEGELVDVRVVPDVLQFVTLRSVVEELEGLPVVSLAQSPITGWSRIAKRGMDIVCATVGLLVLSPVLGLIAVAIRLGSPGPVLFRQERMGLDGRSFQMYKFRSMRDDAEAETGPVWASDGDCRRTGLGRLLRRFSLDELPQLWNVLRGEMSLVGPRPERPFFVHQFKTLIPQYMLRHKVKSGMTGWAQVNGLRGNTSLEKRIEYDLYYIQNWSIALDVKIVLLTAYRAWQHRYAQRAPGGDTAPRPPPPPRWVGEGGWGVGGRSRTIGRYRKSYAGIDPVRRPGHAAPADHVHLGQAARAGRQQADPLLRARGAGRLRRPRDRHRGGGHAAGDP
jgi:Undecaprenyl-phosphate glucose phosphotransferase